MPLVVVAASVTCALFALTWDAVFERYGLPNPLWVGGTLGGAVEMFGSLGTVVVLACLLVAVILVVARFDGARGAERQQIKWFTYAAAVLLVTLFFSSPVIAWGLPGWMSFPLGIAGLCAIPLAVGIAILRYRLYDIDRIINRTLVYVALTAILAGIYVAGVAASQGFVRALTGQEQSQLAIVAFTLVIAALFSPLRRRIQSFIDRRFYRRRYDARKTLEAFSVTLRDETDLDALNDDLVGVVRETMQPAHVSLWLRPDTASKGNPAG
jgi:hypothetical protein